MSSRSPGRSRKSLEDAAHEVRRSGKARDAASRALPDLRTSWAASSKDFLERPGARLDIYVLQRREFLLAQHAGKGVRRQTSFADGDPWQRQQYRRQPARRETGQRRAAEIV